MHSGTRAVVCAEVNALQVNVTLSDGPFQQTLPFSCALGIGTSGHISSGTYTVTVESRVRLRRSRRRRRSSRSS